MKTASIDTSAGTIETTSNVELVSGELHLKTTGTSTYGCSLTATDNNVEASTFDGSAVLANQSYQISNIFTTPSSMRIQNVVLRLKTVNTPSGSVGVELQSTNATDPSGTAVASTSSVLFSAAGTTPNGDSITFALTSPYQTTSGQAIAIVLKPQTGATLDASNNMRWISTVQTAGSSPTGCTDFSTYRYSNNSGASWTDGFSSSVRRQFFLVTADAHPTTGAVSWILTGSPQAIWLMSSFAMTENPNGIYGGTFTYDIGTGESSTTASYQYTAQTKAQVKALGSLTGTYLYIRANFAISSVFDQAALTGGSVNYH